MTPAKVEVHFWSGLRALTDGRASIEVEARNVGDVIDGVAREFPDLKEFLEENVSVAVDGRIIADSLVEPVPEGAEVWLMQRLKGG